MATPPAWLAVLLLPVFGAACARPVAAPLPAPAAPPLAPSAGLNVRLIWEAPVDLDLYLTDPTSETVYFANNPSRTKTSSTASIRAPTSVSRGPSRVVTRPSAVSSMSPARCWRPTRTPTSHRTACRWHPTARCGSPCASVTRSLASTRRAVGCRGALHKNAGTRFVMPAKSGIQVWSAVAGALDSGFRRNDDLFFAKQPRLRNPTRHFLGKAPEARSTIRCGRD